MNYTKVEWKYDNNIRRVSSNNVQISQIQKSISIKNKHFISNEEVDCNGRLSSAAPDMYEALKALYNSLPDGYASECLPQVRKALKKAEGNL